MQHHLVRGDELMPKDSDFTAFDPNLVLWTFLVFRPANKLASIVPVTVATPICIQAGASMASATLKTGY